DRRLEDPIDQGREGDEDFGPRGFLTRGALFRGGAFVVAGAFFSPSYSSRRIPRMTPSWYTLSKKTASRIRPSSRNPIFFASARLPSFSAKVHQPTRCRLSCSKAS